MPPLTDVAARKAKPAEKPQRLYDTGGLYLEVAPASGKYWRLKCRFGGRRSAWRSGCTRPSGSQMRARGATTRDAC